MKTNQRSVILDNETLFELPEIAQTIKKELYEFLCSTTYPWELLGKNFEDFLFQMINKYPQNERIQGFVHPQATLEGTDIVIEKGASVEAGAFITGPTYIEAQAAIRHGAYVRGHVFVGAHAVVGHTTEVKGSILLAHAKAAHFAYVGNSVLGIDTNLGAGTKLANLRFDHQNITLKGVIKTQEGSETLRFETNLKKLGAILGNRAQTGCNSVTNPGTLLTAGSYLKPVELGSGIIHRPLPLKR